MFRRVLNEITSFILPNSCTCCSGIMEADEHFICQDCRKQLEPFDIPHPWTRDEIQAGNIDNSLSAFWFREGKPIQSLMHAMKYQKMRSIGKLLGEEIGKKINIQTSINFDYVLPVPLHKARQRDRTYNQSDFIAAGIAEIIKAEPLVTGITRTRFTGTQTKLNKSQRKENVSGAFIVNPKHISAICGKNIIITDDVITTGATILECAKAVRSAGANIIWVASAAYAELKTSDLM
jgi:ComF family protein